MNKKTTIIFDFDGTIADTLDRIFEIINLLAVEVGFKKLTKKEFGEARKKHPLKVIKQYKIPLWKLPFLIKKGQKMLSGNIDQIKFIPGMEKTLYQLKKKGYRLGILTSNSKENIEKFLSVNKLGIFEFVYCSGNLFGKSGSLRNILNKYNLKKEEVIYVGDEVRDIEACQKVGIEMIAVTWGFNSRETLVKYKPQFIIDKPEELLFWLK